MVGDDLTCEVVARALAAGGVGRLCLVRRTGALPRDVATALVESNPEVVLEIRSWPESRSDGWIAVLAGASAVVRSGFDDDPMLRAAIRLGLPVVVTRGRDDRVDVVSFRRHGPCPHTSLDVAEQAGVAPQDGPGAVLAAYVAAAEILALLAGATTGAARARHVSIPLDDATNREPRAADIPWAPECFACGGSGTEMSFA